MPLYEPSNVANNILERAFRDGAAVSPMKLQKILYFTASEYGKATGKALFREEFEAWQYGPVLRSVYSEFRGYGGRPITDYAKDALGASYVVSEKDDPQLSSALERVWQVSKNRNAAELSRITHLKGSAWYDSWMADEDVIPYEKVKSDETYKDRLGV
ncbi:Panacea domain-containing protein [Jonesia quinghaiensis]|uniref:Panacea domain-containing protein n=1 Tax=Jonesia quinghaiensis TaxID=262806 RepID=UPI00041AE682|nr:type II toxin-antitoxin system antitoxin SocA domain-containing protein [Jonesia quinghaiensis]